MCSHFNEIVVRDARLEDVPELSELNAQLGYPEKQEVIRERLEMILADDEHKILVACNENDKVIGYVHGFVRVMLIVKPHIEVGSLVVGEAYRSRGVGWLLLQKIETWAKNSGYTLIWLHSNIVRQRAHQFYLKYGYKILKKSFSIIKEL